MKYQLQGPAELVNVRGEFQLRNFMYDTASGNLTLDQRPSNESAAKLAQAGFRPVAPGMPA